MRKWIVYGAQFGNLGTIYARDFRAAQVTAKAYWPTVRIIAVSLA